MCHISALTSKLGTVNADILKMAMEVIAQEEGIAVSDSVEDYGRRETRNWKGVSIASLKTKDLPRGIGVAIIGGKLQFVGDSYGCKTAFNEMKDRIELTYKNVAMIAAWKELKYQVYVHQGESILTIEAVKE